MASAFYEDTTVEDARDYTYLKCMTQHLVLMFFDKLFDSFNGSFSKITQGKVYRCAVQKNSPHHKLWEESLQVLKTMKFLDSNGKKINVPSINGSSSLAKVEMGATLEEIVDGIRFADYFVICGLDIDSGLEPDRLSGDNLDVSPLDRSYKGKVLARYPENVSSNPFDEQAVCMLCLPAGLQFRTQKHLLEPKFHSYLATKEDATRYYGFAFTFYEEVRNKNICTAMQTLQSMYITELSSGNTPPTQRKANGKEVSRSLPRSFKLTPHNASALAYFDITKDKLYVAKCIALICQFPYVRAAKSFLVNLYKSLPRQPGPGLSPESYVYNLLYEVPVPTPGQALQFYIPPPEQQLQPKSMIIYRPKPPEELPLLDYPLRELFHLLGVHGVLQLFSCATLEHQILLRSSEYNSLMLVAECISGLLCPFVWAHVYVPVLPAPLHHFLDAPVPFIMGLHSESSWSVSGPQCVVELDRGIVKTPEDLPSFPHLSAFAQEINHLLDKYQVQRPESDMTSKWNYGGNGLSAKYAYADVSSSCTLPAGGMRRTPAPRPAPKSEALQRLVQVASRTSVEVNEVEMPTNRRTFLTADEQNDEDTKFNAAMREIFINRFVHMFQFYENFVIMPDQDRESWMSSRESMVNFDKSAFLSDQPSHARPFLSRFLETQMFATLIDNKILSTWGDYDINLEVFEHRIKAFSRRGVEAGRSYAAWCGTTKAVPSPSAQVPLCREKLPHRAAYYRAFPSHLDRSSLTPPSNRTSSLKRIKNAKWRVRDVEPTIDLNPRLSTEITPNAIAQNHRAFVEKLLKECKTKSKKMLLEKMSIEEPELGFPPESSLGGVEENTQIASLCDLLERLWSHGLQQKAGKSALWTHLCNYQELEQCHNSETPIDPSYLTPDLTTSVPDEVDTSPAPSPGRSRNSSRCGSRDSSRDRLGSGSNTLERKSQTQPNPLRALPDNLTFDMRNVQAMSDIKTDIGYARAWVRLSLEKKALSKHFRELLADNTLLRSMYKRTAFLRCEEEREQFLYHMLTLNAVDYHCFTNTYPSTKLPYRVLIIPSKRASGTTANCWIAISGTLNQSTPKIPIPKNANEFVFHHKNMGVLSTLRIGHDNSGLSPRWLLECVFVRNEVTGQTYRFPCSRWLGSGVDDGSTERVLVAHELPSPVPRAAPATPTHATQSTTTTHLSASTIQHMIGDCVNAIVKWHYQSRRDKDPRSLSVLLCGENGLVKCLEQAFLCGFKSARMFGRNLFIWDYFVKVKDEFYQSLSDENYSTGSDECASYSCRNEHRSVWRCYSHLLDQINNAGSTLGKDGKFQLFICVSLREHWLHRMLVPMSLARVTSDMYEEQSFLRKKGLLTFLRQILEPLDEFDIVLESSLTQGI